MLNHNVAWSGGTFFRAYHFARQLARRGHDVTLLTISPQRHFGFRQEERDGVHLVETPDWLWGRGRTGWDPWDTLQRIRYLRRGTWDLIHAFDSRPAVILPALVLQRRGVPLVLDWADWWGRGGTIEERDTGPMIRIFVGPIETWFEETFRTRAQGTTVISSALRQRAISLGVRAESIVQIPGGSDIDNVHPLPQDMCRRELGLPERIPIVGYVGILNKNDAQLLFNMFTRLLQTHPDCRLLMVGRHRTTVLDLPGILETGYVKHAQLLQCLGACDLMLLPLKDTISSRGRWPSKINDYLAAGRPIVASAVGDVRTLFEQHDIGEATSDTPEALAQAVGALLVDASRRDTMGRNARKVAETKLAWPILAEKLETHYLNVIGSYTSAVNKRWKQ